MRLCPPPVSDVGRTEALMLSECTGLRVVVASESSAGGLKNALPTGWWLALERSGRASGSRCGVARNRREQIDSHQECRRGITTG